MATKEFDIRNVVDAFNAHDAERVVGNYAQDAEVNRSGLAEPIRGRDEYRKRVQMFLDAFPDFHIDIERDVQKGDTGAAECRITGTHNGELRLGPNMRVPATNKKVDYRIAIFAETNEDGLIERETGIFDTMELVRQLGVRPDQMTARTR